MKDFKHVTKKPASSFRWKGISLFIAVIAVLTPLTVLLIQKGAGALESLGQDHTTTKPAPTPLDDKLFGAACTLLPKAVQTGNSLMVNADDGTALQYSINPELQTRVNEYFIKNRVPYAILVAVEPSTGRILALASYSSVDPSWAAEAPYNTYPMASLFKMVTAAAALEQGKISPNSVMAFRGRSASENPRYWDAVPRKRNRQMDLTEAMGKSVNPIYGRIASDLLGTEPLMGVTERFGFNQQILPGVPVKTSQAPRPASTKDLRLLGSGLDHDLRVSPIHAAAITAGFANNGVMMTPRIVDRASRGEREQTVPAPRQLRRIVAPEVANDLTRMMLTTVSTGTSHKAFSTPQGKQLVSTISIAAKTGSIDGTDPKGHYSWFAAYAPANQPKIAIVALVINRERWKIKASQVGELALSQFFSK
jgi:cell division protein FtsI/penicillin-binding protein 2